MSSTIAVEKLWKVFGPRPDRIVGTPLAELPRAEAAAEKRVTAHEATWKPWIPA